MGKEMKKGKRGSAAEYYTRSQAIRKMQVSLNDFRRLCILKGVYPREPKKKFKGSDKTYYHRKDVHYLMHDQLLDKFRSIKSHMKKQKKAVKRGDKGKAAALLKSKPTYSLHYIIKQRYPTFPDALRDLDDALTLLSMFASFPTHETLRIPKERINVCQKLVAEFCLYVILSQTLSKTFLSIKGIYYQAVILGVPITWTQPYKFAQKLPFDVDYKIMMSFAEFYESLLSFANFKLYKDAGLEYPPPALSGVNLDGNIVFSRIQEDVFKLQKQARRKLAEVDPETAPHRANKSLSALTGLRFFVNREIPVYSLEMLLLSAGCPVGFEDEGSPYGENAQGVTHQVVDRPLARSQMQSNREYVQPQWVFDCLNHAIALPVAPYAPGKVLPAHLSPFVDNAREGYIPARQKEINQMKGVEEEAMELVSEEEEEDEEEKVEEGQEEEKKGGKERNPDEEYTDEEEEKKEKLKRVKIKKQIRKENKELGQLLMTKKARRLYTRMQLGQRAKKEQAHKLFEKRKKLDKPQPVLIPRY